MGSYEGTDRIVGDHVGLTEVTKATILLIVVGKQCCQVDIGTA